MALEGNLETFYLSSLFQLLSNDKKTGKLRISNDDDVVTVNFSEGTIIFATSTENEKHLGNLLRSEGVIGDIELENHLLTARNRKQRLGEVLVDEGCLTRDELTEFIRMQAENILFSIFMWPTGHFRFEECEISFSDSTDTQFDTMDLILEASRRADELTVLREQLPPRNQILRYSTGAAQSAAAKNLSLQETAVLRLVNGTRSVKQIIQQSSYDEFTASKAIHTIISEGLVEAKEKAALSLSGDKPQGKADLLADQTEGEVQPLSPLDQNMQRSAQIQTLYEKNLKPAPRKKTHILGISALLLIVLSTAATGLLYREELLVLFAKKDSAPGLQAPVTPQEMDGQDQAKARIPETQSLQDINSFFFLSLPAGFTVQDRSTKKKSLATLSYAANITVDIEARAWPARWNVEDAMYAAIADLQTQTRGRAHPAIEAYSRISLGGGQGYEITTTENINAQLVKTHLYKLRAHRKMISITVTCTECDRNATGSLFSAVDEMIKKSLLVYP